MLCATDKLYLKTLGQRPRTFVDITNTNGFYSDKSPREKMAFLGSPVGLTSRRPSSTPRVCTDGVRLVVRSYADVITKFSRVDGLPIFITHGASLARFARGSSTIKTTDEPFCTLLTGGAGVG